ncbi:MAG TPA: OmpA family protein [Alphaproteobacteria bacterium]|nr:OmpA family protein [Alphaproteobacteria bacterium]
MDSSVSRRVALAVMALAGVSYAPKLYAQATGAGAATNQLEEIVVTARRTEEKQQTVPVAVTAITSAAIERMNIQSPTQLSQVIPNFVLSQGAGGPTNVAISIRGIGNQEPLLTVDSPVGVYLDGVYLGRDAGLNIDLVDLERVEVLRGPQGTLFGRNTSGGAVNMISKDPTADFGFEEKAGYGSEDGWFSRTTVNTGNLGNGDNTIRATISYLHRDRDGWVDNPYASDYNDPGSLHSDAVWAKIRADFGDSFTLVNSFDYDTENGQPEGFQLAAMSDASKAYFSQSPLFGGDPLVLSGKRLSTLPLYRFPQQGEHQHSATIGDSLTASYYVNDEVTLKSISAYRHWYASEPTRYGAHYKGLLLNPVTGGVSVGDASPFYAPQDVGQYQYSEEAQITWKTDRWNTVGGLYYFYEHVHEDNPNYFTFVIPTGVANPAYLGLNLGPPSQELKYRENSASYAAYGQTTYKPPILDDRMSLTAGIRYTIDHRSIDLIAPSTGDERTGNVNYYNFNYNASLNFQFTDDIMGYVRFSSGYKAGGFNARVTDATSSLVYNPEKATAYEIGIKTEWLDHRLRFNATGFYTDYADLQVNQYTGGVGTTTNANAYYEGFELESQFIPFKELALDGSIGYVNPVYTYYPYQNPANAGIVTDIRNYASIAHFPYVPDWTIHVGAQYYFPEQVWGAPSLRVDYSMMSERYWFSTNLANANPFNNVIKDPGQNLLSARLILSDIPVSAGAKAEIQVYGTNLLDQDLRDSGIDFGGLGFAGISFGEPRSVGFTLDLKYGATEEPAAPAAAYVPPPVVAPAAPKSYLVFFDFNKSDLTPQAKDIVDTAAKNASAGKVTQLTVTGHTDTVGSDAYNMRLSRRRAESVATQLEKDGVASSEIEIVAKGKRDLLVPTADGVREPQNRRVQIVFDGGASS